MDTKYGCVQSCKNSFFTQNLHCQSPQAPAGPGIPGAQASPGPRHPLDQGVPRAPQDARLNRTVTCVRVQSVCRCDVGIWYSYSRQTAVKLRTRTLRKAIENSMFLWEIHCPNIHETQSVVSLISTRMTSLAVIGCVITNKAAGEFTLTRLDR